MSLETIIALLIACFIIKATPGPGVFATVGRALFQGFGPTLVFIAGIMTGDFLYLLFAFTGLAVIAHQFGEFFFVIRLIGGGYLIYLGVRLWFAPPAAVEAGCTADSLPAWPTEHKKARWAASPPLPAAPHCFFLQPFSAALSCSP